MLPCCSFDCSDSKKTFSLIEMKRRTEIALLIVTVFIFFIGLVLMILGLTGIIPISTGIIPAIFLLVLSCVCFVAMSIKMEKQSISGVIRNQSSGDDLFDRKLFKKANLWCIKKFKDASENMTLINGFSAENHYVNPDSVTGKICREHKEAFRLICQVGGKPLTDQGVVIGCYPILIKSLLRIEESIEVLKKDPRYKDCFRQVESLPNEEKLLYLIAASCKVGLETSEFLGITAGFTWMFRSYMGLRIGYCNGGGQDDIQFFDPQNDNYLARLVFNDARRAVLSLFSLKTLEKFSQENETINSIYQACLSADEGNTFKLIHRDYIFVPHYTLQIFCN